MKKLVAIAAVAVLAACSGGTEEAADGETVAGADEVEMQAGQWSNSVTIEKFDIPGAPQELAGMFQSMVGQTKTSEVCRTQEDIDKSMEEFAKEPMNNENCKTEDLTMAGGKISGRVVCDQQGKGSAVLTLEGTHSATSMEMTMTADIESSDMPGGKAQMIMKVTGERTGDCAS